MGNVAQHRTLRNRRTSGPLAGVAELTLIGLGLAVAVAVPLGVLAATRQNSWLTIFWLLVTAGVSANILHWPPTCLHSTCKLGVVAAWSPRYSGLAARVTGFYTLDSLIVGDQRLSCISGTAYFARRHIGVVCAAPIARMTGPLCWAHLLATSFNCAPMAFAQGCREYAFRNAALLVLTTPCMVFFSCWVPTFWSRESSWPGIGSFAIEALVTDYAAAGFVLAMALLFVCVNLVIDIILTLTDPRVGLDD